MPAALRRTSTTGQANLAGVLNHEDLRARARRALPLGLWQFVDGGAEDEITLARNTRAFQELCFQPRMGVWHPAPRLKTRIFGLEVSMPILTAPCGGLRQLHPEGDLGVARAAARAGTVQITSSASGHTLEEIAAIDGPKWFQLYRFWGRQGMESLVGRAQAANYRALVVTIDSPVSGSRERDLRYAFRSTRLSPRRALALAPQLLPRPRWVWRYWRDGMPFGLANTAPIGPGGRPLPLSAMGQSGPESLCASWEEIAWIRDLWHGPLVVKGVLSGEDARRAVASGADGVIVSNHGGRQLDGAPATIDVLPRIVEAIGEESEILLDSGVRRGADVVKAMALGAGAVLVGRPYVWGLAAAGQAGVEHMLGLLRADMVRTLQLIGCAAVEDLDASWLTYA